MKTKVEIEGYEIEISFEEGVISVSAQKDDEVVEEFSINVEEGQGESEDGEEVQNFGDYEEEEDFSGEDLEDELEGEDDEDDDDDENESPAAALESFQSFINKKTTKRKK
jgi:hypothetical protein